MYHRSQSVKACVCVGDLQSAALPPPHQSYMPNSCLSIYYVTHKAYHSHTTTSNTSNVCSLTHRFARFHCAEFLILLTHMSFHLFPLISFLRNISASPAHFSRLPWATFSFSLPSVASPLGCFLMHNHKCTQSIPLPFPASHPEQPSVG